MNILVDEPAGLNALPMDAGHVRATRVLYLAHDLDDAAIWRRVRMLRLGGADVTLIGFRRRQGPLPGDAVVLGQTHNARMGQRIGAVLRQRLNLNKVLTAAGAPDVILCRNLEMLALAVPLKHRLRTHRPVSLIYEVLDIHRLMVGDGLAAKSLRWFERRLCREIDRLIVSSPAFLRAYFEPHKQTDAPVSLVENKVVTDDLSVFEQPITPRPVTKPLRIGWFGILRCPFSLKFLDALTRARPGQYRIIMRGRPALDTLRDFHAIVQANPDLVFEGPYAYPGDLATIYGEVDMAWLVDRYDTGSNSDWLLPNRLYESGLNGVPPIGLKGTEIAARMAELGIGTILDSADIDATLNAFDQLDSHDVAQLQDATRAVARDTWLVASTEAENLVSELAPDGLALLENPMQHNDGVLIVVPTLNEAAHIGDVIDDLVPFLQRRLTAGAPTRLVVADGGSVDGTEDIVQARIEALPAFDIHLLPNPGRLQSAALNLAVATHGTAMGWLVRLDAHARYPSNYIDTLLDDAIAHGADSVVVPMNAVGDTALQRMIALTQNTRLGNGGSAHRIGGEGRFVDHGHHALMRLDAFRTVGGYDTAFSHNEDAELDLRLAKAGGRIWLTAQTELDYIPRASLGALARQYFNFGRGRARTVLKHRQKPRLRQIAMIGVAPAVAMTALAPVLALFAAPALIWLAACLLAALVLALSQQKIPALLSGVIAAVMHLAWSAGFWRQVFAKPGAPQHESVGLALASAPLAHVAVGVCTFQRPALSQTLRTLEGQVLPDGTSLTIIVIDNDTTPSARDMVERFAGLSSHSVIYRHAPAGNISIARNAALDVADERGFKVFAFIDDDELAPADWLRRLVARLSQGDADVVVGPIRAIYAPDAPRWMQRLRLHDTHPELGSDGRPIAGHSCNVIMDLSVPALNGRRFDLARGISGGEDTAFFKDAAEAGARLALAPLARLDEPVTPARARLSWLLKRRFRMGQTHGSLLRKHQSGVVAHLTMLPLALSKVLYCATVALLAAPFSGTRNANLLRGALHFGTVAALIGIKDVSIYGHRSTKSGNTSTP